MATILLNREDRAFLSLVSEAAFANPFSQRRAALDRKILGRQAHRPWQEMVPEVLEQIRKKIATLDKEGRVRLHDFQDRDRLLMTSVFLFDIFHKYNLLLDDIIKQQIERGAESVPVPFGQEGIQDLKSRGFTQAEALRFFGLFYQIRRAYHFIARGLVGDCTSMRCLREHLWNSIFTCDIQHFEASLWDRMEDFSILLLGPTGAGKGAAAAAIGRSGYIPFNLKQGSFAKSFTETFISVNLSQYAETLLESELFGHTKGAFTGAVSSHEGLLSLCGHHGAIFLDEIGDISPAIQTKLLKVLEERSFYPVGSHKSITFHGRVIAATNRSIQSLRSEGLFRDDFYYRLCSDCIKVPGLQQRIQESAMELDLMIAHTVERITGTPDEALCKTVRQVIDKSLGPDYAWPGNVRELAQCVRRVIIRHAYEGDFKQTTAAPHDRLAEQLCNCTLRAETLLALYCKALFDRFGTFEEVARRADLDRRTVKRYIQRTTET
jgi:transcriptional regulator with AAA-type ATPase domain